MPSITFDNVSVRLGGISILDSVTAEVPEASATAIIGPNGAGKTTLLLALLGHVPHSGTIRMGPNGGSVRQLRSRVARLIIWMSGRRRRQ